MIAGVLFFGLVVFVISFMVARRAALVCEISEIATYIAVVAWSSLAFGLYISKFVV